MRNFNFSKFEISKIVTKCLGLVDDQFRLRFLKIQIFENWSLGCVGSPKREMLCKRCACHEIGTCFRTLELSFKLVFYFCHSILCASIGHGRVHWTRPYPVDAAASIGRGRVHWTRWSPRTPHRLLSPEGWPYRYQGHSLIFCLDQCFKSHESHS